MEGTKDGEKSNLLCFKTLQCFKVAYKPLLRDIMLHFFVHAPLPSRRERLAAMYTTNACFVFNGRHFCSALLKYGFHFSRDLHISVKDENASSRLQQATNEEQPPVNDHQSSEPSAAQRFSIERDMATVHHEESATGPLMILCQVGAVIICLQRLVRMTPGMMQDTNEANMPFTTKKELYEIFVQ